MGLKYMGTKGERGGVAWGHRVKGEEWHFSTWGHGVEYMGTQGGRSGILVVECEKGGVAFSTWMNSSNQI